MSQQKVTVEVEVKPTGDLSQQKAQVEQLAKSLNAAKDAAKAIAVPDKPQEKRREDAATDKKPQRAETVVADTEPQEPQRAETVVADAEPQEPQRAETVVADAEPQEPQRAETVVADTGPQEPQRAETVVADPVSQFESMRDRLNRSVAASGMDQEELQLFDLANLGATQEQLQEIAGLWKTLKDSKVELKVQGFEEAARHKIKTAAMTDDEVRLFDLENLGATEEQLQAVKNLQSQIKTADVEVKVNQIEKKVDRAAETSGMTPDEIQLFDMQQLGATEEQLQRIRELQKEIQAANVESRVQSFEQGVKREVETSGMKPEEVQLFDLKSAGATEEQLQRIRDLQGQRTGNGLARSIDEVEKSLQKQIATMGMSADETQIWELKQRGATDKQLEAVKDLQQKRQSLSRAGRLQSAGGIATQVVGSVSGQAGQVLGGAIGGAQTGFALGGVGGAAAGMAIGAATSMVGDVFGAIKEGIDLSLESSEKFRRTMDGVADSVIRSEAVLSRMRRTGMPGLSDFSAVDPVSRGRIMTAPRSDRPAIIRERLAETSEELDMHRSLRPFMGGLGEARLAEGDAGIVAREASVAVLRRGAESGIEGVTRDESMPTSISDASSVYDSIAMMIGERAPAERTAEAAEEIRDTVEWIREALEALERPPAPSP